MFFSKIKTRGCLLLALLSTVLTSCVSAPTTSSGPPIPPPKSGPDYSKHTPENQEGCDIGNPILIQPPGYPVAAIRARQEGWVLLQYDLVAGVPKNITAVDSSPRDTFNNAAIKAWERVRFNATNQLGEPNNCEGALNFMSFELE